MNNPEQKIKTAIISNICMLQSLIEIIDNAANFNWQDRLLISLK